MYLRLLLLTFFVSSVCSAQLRPFPSPPKPPTKKQLKEDDRNHYCKHRNHYTASQRLSFYPFSKANQVQLVSFDNKPDSAGIITWGSNTLPMKEGSVDFSKLDEVITLTKPQIDTLTDILYNIGYKGNIFTVEKLMCYNPRNAIVFADSKGQTFAFLELGFECGGYRASSEKVEAGDFCWEKMKLLKAFFGNAGIEIGVTKGTALIEEE